MRESTWVSLLLLLLLPAPQWGGPQDGRPEPEPEPERGPLQPFDLLYASGVAAYYSGDYERAVRDLEAALRSHRRLRDIRTRCARHCAARRPLAPLGAGPGAELPFFRALLERARCSRSCQRQRLGGPVSRHRVSEDVRSDFQRRVPYNYLQRAYIKPLARTREEIVQICIFLQLLLLHSWNAVLQPAVFTEEKMKLEGGQGCSG
ncbi:Prolyl 3-hydroxylase 2 [Microtus ochrogaster]|uniref:Prolyl 3-hydroxylase 2 n=1 Tax=Microtus ochrogaster TaxID=79684 RepID=A0A8J6G7W8_MICOH|nr:Prolyl 3-hydroxylase 2 [Microtus ochrogaster]